MLELRVNGGTYRAHAEVGRSLAETLREDLGLTGTKVACNEGHCGACTVLVDGDTVKSCTLLAAQADGRQVQTIEGVAQNGELHPLQRAFHEQHALQCGFCTPGMIMAAMAVLERNPSPSDDEIRKGLEGNLCRCTGYHNIVEAVKAAARDEQPAARRLVEPLVDAVKSVAREVR